MMRLPGVLDVLHCILIDSPEALNMVVEKHIVTIIALIDKHGRDSKVYRKHSFTCFFLYVNEQCC